jgi:hypothetical protein
VLQKPNTGQGPAAPLPGVGSGPTAARTTGPHPRAPARTTGPAQLVRPSPAHDTMAPPTGAMEPVALDGDAMTVVGGESYAGTVATRRRALAIGGGAAAMLAIAAAVWGIARNDSQARPGGAELFASAPAAAHAPANPGITVEPIQPPAAAAPRTGSDDEIEMQPDDPPAAGSAKTADPVANRRPTHDAVHRPAHKDPPRLLPAPPVVPALTREQLGQKFQQVRREYDDYKAKYGSRLEKEWGDLAMFIQYVSEDDAWRREAARRLDEFRSRMRE